MATIKPLVVVSDAGPLIHLDELGCLDLLQNLGDVFVSREVLSEVLRHRPKFALSTLPNAQVNETISPPSARLTATSDSLDLDIGERASLALMESVSAKLFLCDDAAARLAAESLGFAVRGTIGILVRSIRVAARTQQEVLNLLRELPHKSSLHVSRRLLESVIAEVERAADEV